MRKSAQFPCLLPVLRPHTIKHLKHCFNCLVQCFLYPRIDHTLAFFCLGAFFFQLLTGQQTSSLLILKLYPYHNSPEMTIKLTLSEYRQFEVSGWSERNRNTEGSKFVRGFSYCIRPIYRTQNMSSFQAHKPFFWALPRALGQ